MIFETIRSLMRSFFSKYEYLKKILLNKMSENVLLNERMEIVYILDENWVVLCVQMGMYVGICFNNNYITGRILYI